MKSYDLASVLSGIIFIIIGLILLRTSFSSWSFIFYALLCLGVGVSILVTLKKQNRIEQIKIQIKTKSYKKKEDLK